MTLRRARQPHGPANARPRLLNQQGGSHRSTVTVPHSVQHQRGDLLAADPKSFCIGSRHSEARCPAMRHLGLNLLTALGLRGHLGAFELPCGEASRMHVLSVDSTGPKELDLEDALIARRELAADQTGLSAARAAENVVRAPQRQRGAANHLAGFVSEDRLVRQVGPECSAIHERW